jgi:hypothetical protein
MNFRRNTYRSWLIAATGFALGLVCSVQASHRAVDRESAVTTQGSVHTEPARRLMFLP